MGEGSTRVGSPPPDCCPTPGDPYLGLCHSTQRNDGSLQMLTFGLCCLLTSGFFHHQHTECGRRVVGVDPD